MASAATAELFSAQSPQIHFTNLDAERSLSHPVIFSIEQDSQGFIWLATQDGLNRYDGIKTKQYSYQPGSSNSLSSGWVWDIHNDREGRLWVAAKGGINLYLPELDAFKVFSKGEQYPGIAGSDYRAIAEAADGTMWFGSHNNGLTRYDVRTGQFSSYQANDKDPGSIKDNHIRALLIDSKQRLWVASDGGGISVRLNPDGPFQHHTTTTELAIPSDRIRTLYEDKHGLLWVGTEDAGVFSFDLQSGVRQHFNKDPQNPASLCSSLISDIYQDKQDRLWFASDDGLCELPPASQSFIRHGHENGRPDSLTDNRVLSLFQDQGGVIWVGTFGGASRWNADLQRFTHISQGNALGKSLSSNVILSFAQDSDENLYVGTWGGGINRLNPRTQEIVTERATENTPGALLSDRVMSLLVDSNDHLWVGTQNKGLHWRAKGQSDFKTFQHNDANDSSISANAISKIIELSDGTIAIATYGGGINLYDPTQENQQGFIRLQHDNNAQNSLSSDRVLDIIEADDGNLWIATDGGGINRYLREQGFFERYQKDQLNQHALTSNEIPSLLDTQDYLWVATQDAGVARLNKQQLRAGKAVFEHFTRNNGLPSNAAYGLLEDAKGYIWISHSRGLSRLDPDDMTVLNFNTSHGLQPGDFNSGAYYRSADGRMFFGGSNGFNTFKPDTVPVNENSPPVRLTEFSKFNKAVPVHTAFRNDGVLELQYSDSVIGFEFAALDYTQPEDNYYQYRMAGLNDQWVDAQNNNRITFSNLSDGRYTFQVRGSNNDKQWNSDWLAVDIEVLPPPWRTWYAYLGYTLMALLGLYLIYHRQQQHFRQQWLYRQQLEAEVKQRTVELQNANDNLAEAIVETETARGKAEDAARAKSDFLATMSHEIRTPMNSILGMGELLMSTELTSIQQRYASTAYRSGEMLLDLINDILDFSKMEVSKIRLEHLPFDVHSVIEESVLLIAGRAHEKEVEIATEIGVDCCRFINGDALRIRQILTNLVGNAVKFTEYGHIRVTADSDDQQLTIRIADTGIGMSPAQQQNIFTAFEQADSSTTRRFGGTGLGLTITKTLVELMEGTISVTSEENKGSEFTVRLPFEPATEHPDGLNLELLANAEIKLVVENPVIKAMAVNSLARLNLSAGDVTSPQDIPTENHPRQTLYLVDEPLLDVSAWFDALSPIPAHVIAMTRANSDPSRYALTGAQFLSKPLLLSTVYDALLQQLGIAARSTREISPLAFAANHRFNAKVLLVEDAKTNQEVATHMLALFGCKVEIADNGAIAVEKVKKSDFDLILMDCQMPVMDGFTATRHIRQWHQQQQYPQATIVALTAGMGQSHQQECLDAGMDECMLKPFTAKQLLTTLNKYVSHRLEDKTADEIESSGTEATELSVTPADEPSEASQTIDNIDTDEWLDMDSIDSILMIQQQTGRNIFDRVLTTFQQEMEAKMPQATAYYQQQDANGLSQTAHAMKSLTGNVGARKLRQYCHQIEQAGLEDNLPACEVAVKALKPCYHQTMKFLSELSKD